MSYVQRVLQPGEVVRHTASTHWIVYWPGAVCMVAAGAVLLLGPRLSANHPTFWYLGREPDRRRRPVSAGPRMVRVVDDGDRGHQPARHLQDRLHPAPHQRDEHGQGRERAGRPVHPRPHPRLRHRGHHRHRRGPGGAARDRETRSSFATASPVSHTATMSKAPKAPRHLGKPSAIPASPEQAVLDRVQNPHADTDYVARFTAPEFTTLCPITGQPDFAHLVIDYVPGKWLVELKSLKLYLNSYRNHGAFHEDCTVAIGKRLVRPAQAEMAAHRRLLVSARRHADRRVLAGRQAAEGYLGAGPGRRAVSRQRLEFLDNLHALRRPQSASTARGERARPSRHSLARTARRACAPGSPEADRARIRLRAIARAKRLLRRCAWTAIRK